MKFKIGDKVKAKQWGNTNFPGHNFVRTMHTDETRIIIGIHNECVLLIADSDGARLARTSNFLDLVQKAEVINTYQIF